MKILFLSIGVLFLNCGKNSDTIKKNLSEVSVEKNKESVKVISNSTSDEHFRNKTTAKVVQEASNILKYLPVNYSLKGDMDYTKELQKALNENKTVVMPNFPIAINYNGLTLQNDSKITFQNNSKLIILSNSQTNYQALLVKNANNVTIINPVLIGDRDSHIGSSGEWGMGINILSSSNITITNPKISKFWGDGIYIGRNQGSIAYCNTIKISGGILDNNRRNGISIISGKDITIDNMTIKNTNGTNPMAGIDLEPNLNDEYLYNINLNNIKTINNKVDGIKVVFHKLTNKNNILVNIDNHMDQGSQNPLTLVGVDNKNGNSFGGILNYTNPKWSNSNSNIRVQRNLPSDLKLNINKVNINGKMLNKSIK